MTASDKVRIEKHLRTLAKNHGISKWMKKRGWPAESYWTAIDALREGCRAVGQDGLPDPDWPTLADLLTRMLDKAEHLYDYVAGNNQDTEKAEEWYGICHATAWKILERYHQALEAGEWPKK